MLRRSQSFRVLAALVLALSPAGCDSATGPSVAESPGIDAPVAPFMATAEYVEMASTLRELYDRAVERGYTREDIALAAAVGDPGADARMLGLTASEVSRTTRRLESLRSSLETKYPGLGDSSAPGAPVGHGGPGGIEAVGSDGMNQTAAAGCRWIPALSTLYRCSRNGTLTVYIRCALVTWSTYCDDLDFTDFLEGVGPASDALGGGGGGAY